jgi:methylglutaconyl-CoA hydratase
MPNPFTHPLVELPDTSPTADMVRIEATQDGAATLVLNRAASHNAFEVGLVSAVSDALETLHGAEGVRVVFVRGAGGTFSADAGLHWMRDDSEMSESDHREDAIALAVMLKRLWDLPALTVAVVEGVASGVGAGLVAACDLAIASREATFGFPEVRLGLIPAAVAPYVVAAVGARAARGLFASGREIDAAAAQRLGLVDEVVDDTAALEAAQARIAREVLACAPDAMETAKRLVADVAGREIDHRLMEETARRLAAARVGEEAQEGLRAGRERRKPDWAGG